MGGLSPSKGFESQPGSGALWGVRRKRSPVAQAKLGPGRGSAIGRKDGPVRWSPLTLAKVCRHPRSVLHRRVRRSWACVESRFVCGGSPPRCGRRCRLRRRTGFRIVSFVGRGELRVGVSAASLALRFSGLGSASSAAKADSISACFNWEPGRTSRPSFSPLACARGSDQYGTDWRGSALYDSGRPGLGNARGGLDMAARWGLGPWNGDGEILAPRSQIPSPRSQIPTQ